jgi:glyoxylate carboligase
MAALAAAKERHMAQMVADILVGVLEQIGVRQIFGLIGDSLNPLGDAVRRSKIEWIGVRHEEGAALAAAGQAKLTGRLGVCAGTTGPGSTHLVAGLRLSFCASVHPKRQVFYRAAFIQQVQLQAIDRILDHRAV